MNGRCSRRLLRTFSLLLFTATVGCGCPEVDEVLLLDAATISGREYYLVARVTGLQEKVTFFELYADRPTFDGCGQTGARPTAQELYDPDEGFLTGVAVDGPGLRVMYSAKASDAVDIAQIRLQR